MRYAVVSERYAVKAEIDTPMLSENARRSGGICITKFVKNKENDELYIKFLEDKQIQYIIGSDIVVNMSSYKNRKKFDDYIFSRNITRIPVRSNFSGLVLREKIGVEILSVTLQYSHLNISDVDYEINPENGLLKCAEVAGDIEFTKKELGKH